jgi:hypothetical protein
VLLLAGADKRPGLIDTLAALIPDHRDPALITHAMADILRARVLAIACGYPDADDLDILRYDPAFKLACGRLPETGDDVASQPTMSRWESAPDLRTLIRLSRAMVALWCQSHPHPPKAITLDIDDTEAVEARWGASKDAVMRDYIETLYAADSWTAPRRVVARIEATYKGLDTRYVVTNIRRLAPQWLYDSLYCARGQTENLIKRHKSQMASDRTSCRSPLANQMRLTLHTAAYWLMLTLSEAIPELQALAGADFSTIRLRLLKIAVRVQETASRVRLAFAVNCPDAALFRSLIGALILRPT